MNKKVLGIVVGIVLIVLIGLGIVVNMLKKQGIEPVKGVQSIFKPSMEVQSPARYLPKNTLLFYSLSDLQGIWSDVSKSNFWKEFQNLRIMTDFGVKENFKTLVASVEEQIGMELTESRIMDLFGNQINIAIAFSPQTKVVNVFVQSYVGKKTQFVENTLKSMLASRENAATQTVYEGETITHFSEGSENVPDIRYTLVNNILTFGIGRTEDDIKNIIDIIKGKKESLADESVFQTNKAFFENNENVNSYYYTDFTKVSDNLNDLLKPLTDLRPEQFENYNLEEVNKNIAKLKCISGKMIRTSSGIKSISYVTPNFEKMTEEEKSKWNSSPKKMDVLDYVPVEAMLFNANSTLDVSSVWKKVTAAPTGDEVNPMANFLSSLKQLESAYGINIEKDIIENIGDEFAFVFSGLKLDSMIPIPRLSILFETKDAKGLKTKLEKVLNQMLSGENNTIALTLTKENVEGAEFSRVNTPLGEGISPVIGVHNQNIIIATNLVQAQEIIKTQKGKSEKLYNSAKFKTTHPENKEYMQCSFIDLVGLNDQMQAIIKWLLQRKDLIPQAEQYADIATTVSTYAFPVLDLLKVFESAGFSTYLKDNLSVSEFHIVLKDSK